MILEKLYNPADLREIRLVMLRKTGEVQLGRGTTAIDPQWILTVSSDDKVVIGNEEDLRSELFPYVDKMVAVGPAQQPRSGDWKKFLCTPKK